MKPVQEDQMIMSVKPTLGRLRRAWRRLFGEPPDVLELRRRLDESIGNAQDAQTRIGELSAELEKVREERLSWMARESSTRKELQDAQARAKDLLEQVVQLTHRQRATQQSLLDQQFKTQTTPLERNRHEMELAEARGKVKRAEERAARAEEKLCRLQELEKQAGQVKELESQLAWARRQSAAHFAALAAALRMIPALEEQIASTAKQKPQRSPSRKPRAAASGARRPYQKPQIQEQRSKKPNLTTTRNRRPPALRARSSADQ